MRLMEVVLLLKIRNSSVQAVYILQQEFNETHDCALLHEFEM